MHQKIQRSKSLGYVNPTYSQRVTENGRQGQPPRGEKPSHVLDTGAQIGPIFAAGTIIPLFQPAQGIAFNQRIGDTVFLKKLFLNYNCNANNTVAIQSLRIIVFQWFPNSGLLVPTPAVIMQLVASQTIGFYDWQYSNQWRPIYDANHCFSGATGNLTASSNQCFLGPIPMDRVIRRVEFTAGSINASMAIYALAISDQPAVGLVGPLLGYNFRCEYSDE